MRLLLQGWPKKGKRTALVLPARAGEIEGPWSDPAVSANLWSRLADTVRWAYLPHLGADAGSAPYWMEEGLEWDAIVTLPLEREDAVDDLIACANAMEHWHLYILGLIPEASMRALDDRFTVILYPDRLQS